jgi:hypothetical protein
VLVLLQRLTNNLDSTSLIKSPENSGDFLMSQEGVN